MTTLQLRRYAEAMAAVDRGLALAPANVGLIVLKAMILLAQGDLSGARGVISRPHPDVKPTALVAFVSTSWDLFWLLDEPQQQLALRLSPSAFGDDRGAWGLVLAQLHHLRGDSARARIYADSARLAFAAQVRDAPDDRQRHALLALSLAYLGRKSDAIREGERAAELLPISRDAFAGPYVQHLLVRIYLLAGEPDKALERLEPLLKIPYHLSPGWLRVDPSFDPVRQHRKFKRLAEES
jgi:tetratricopeptide (TPR) repeat protein